MVDLAYDSLEGCEDVLKYHELHGTPSLLILTQHSPEIAAASVAMFAEKIRGKTVIEIGAGVGFLAIEMAKVAKSVIAFEIDPAWSWIFTRSLYLHKPTNLTWVFGSAANFVGTIRADVAVIFTCSGVDEMRTLGEMFAKEVLMPMQTPKKFFVDADGETVVRGFKEEVIRRCGGRMAGALTR